MLTARDDSPQHRSQTRGYHFPSPETYDELRPPRYIPLKQRTDDTIKVAMLDKAEAAIEDDDATSVQGDTGAHMVARVCQHHGGCDDIS